MFYKVILLGWLRLTNAQSSANNFSLMIFILPLGTNILIENLKSRGNYRGAGENVGFGDSCFSSSKNSEAKIFEVEDNASAILSASLSECLRDTPTTTLTFFGERSSTGGAIRPKARRHQY